MIDIEKIENIDDKKHIALLDTSSISFMQGLKMKGIQPELQGLLGQVSCIVPSAGVGDAASVMSGHEVYVAGGMLAGNRMSTALAEDEVQHFPL